MPIMSCQKDGKNGWKWGEQGVCFIGPDGRAKAEAVGRAIEANKNRKEQDLGRPDPKKKKAV